MSHIYRQKTSNYRTYLPIPQNAGYTVIGIGGCYKRNGYRITVPEGVEIIEPYAFAGCNDIAYVELPSTLREIGEGAFLDCVSLRELTIPQGVKTIGDLAFHGCGSRVHFHKRMPLTLPASVETVGKEVFFDLPAQGEPISRPEFSAKIDFCRNGIKTSFTVNAIDPYVAKSAITQVKDRPFVLLGIMPDACVIYSHDDEVSLVLKLGETVHTETVHTVGAAYEYTDQLTTYHYISDYTLTELSCT